MRSPPSYTIKTFHFPLRCHKIIALKHPNTRPHKGVAKKIYNSFTGFSLACSQSNIHVQEHNFIKKRPSRIVAGKNEQKAGFTSCLCLFFISIFLCASMEFHYIFPPPTPLLQHPLPLLCQCSCLTTPRISSPKISSNMPSLSNNQKNFSSSCVVPRNLFFTSRSRRSYLGGMGGLARQTPSSSRWLTQMSSIYRKQVLFFLVIQTCKCRGMSESLK